MCLSNKATKNIQLPSPSNALAEVPVFKKSSLAIAYRQTFYNLYNANDFNVFAPTRPSGINGRSKINNKKELTDVDVYPEDYLFRDLNLKYTINFDNGNQFFLSAYGGGDRFNLKAETDILWSPHGRSDQTLKIPYHVNFENNERNMQRGISATYNRVWNNRVQSRFVLSHSDYEKSTSEKIDLQNTKTGLVNNRDIHFIANQTVENSFRVENNISLRNAHQIETGGGFYDNGATLSDQINFRNQAGINYQMNFQSSRFFLYVHDILPIGNRITLNTGARANWVVNSEKLYVEPRLSATIKASETLKVHAAWGIYNQFAYKLANVDMDNNYTWLWVTASEKNTVLHATHWVGGVNYHYKNFTFNVDGYFKTTRNLTRRELVSQNNNASANRNYATLYGVASTYGIDAFVKKDFGQHSVWASYTLSKAEERMAPLGQIATNYTLAPHDQRHELKIAALFKAGSFYFSGNYVYGSEMQIMRELFPNELENISYNRFDAAITYNFNGKLKGETGFSVLNVFDIYNLKYANLKNINIAQNLGSVKIYTGAVPFTPILFLKMVF
ncbi:MAG TPA: TonB-dependent receptor [Prolixibacteraceae bacterium]|nr:TonB-dependent receptor [Prolixibacteraceae bacterium]